MNNLAIYRTITITITKTRTRTITKTVNAPTVRLIATGSLVNVAKPRLRVKG